MKTVPMGKEKKARLLFLTAEKNPIGKPTEITFLLIRKNVFNGSFRPVGKRKRSRSRKKRDAHRSLEKKEATGI